MRPKPLQLTATTTSQNAQMGPGLRSLLIKNVGANDVYIDFDKDIDSSASYLLEAGETVTLEYDFVKFYYKAASGTSALHLIKIIQ